MSPIHQPIPDPESASSNLRQANAEARALLDDAARRLRNILEDEPIIQETPLEAEAVMQSVLDAINTAIRQLDSVLPQNKPSTSPPPAGAPTRQQGQFLAFIQQYMMRNLAGIAPSHADLQRFFNLTPPSVNSMLIRLEQKGFIRRTPGKARAIELTVSPALIPPLDRPFKL